MPPRATEADRPTSVYIIAMGDYVKIGVAMNPASRLKELSTAMPEMPVLFHAREFPANRTAFVIEKMMHRRFSKRRTRGEWFKISPYEAKNALTTMRTPPAEHIASSKWMEPTASEVSDAINLVFGGIGERLDV